VLTVRVGPFSVSAHAGHENARLAPNVFFVTPFDGWFLAYHPRLIDGQGNRLPNDLLHHGEFFNTARRDLICPHWQERIFSAGSEMREWPSLPSVGYRVMKGDRIRIRPMFHNPTHEPYDAVYYEVRIEYKLFADQPGLKNIYPTWLTVGRCGNLMYDLLPGENVKATDFPIAYEGVLLGIGGHLHDYGHQLRLDNTTRKEVIAVLNTTLTAEGRMVSVPIRYFYEEGGYRLNLGDVIKVTATYYNPESNPLPGGGMAMVVGYLLPDDDAKLAALRHDNH
jgi:hypothetical protein